jgi:hypothetical protein
MKIIKSMKKKSAMGFILIAIFICAFFIGLSFVGTVGDNNRISIKPEGFNQLHADAATAPLWDGVRGSATLIRAANLSLNSLFASLVRLAPIESFLSGTINVDNQSTSGYYIRLSDVDKTINDLNVLDATGIIFLNSLEIWRYKSSTWYKGMEFFFNSYIDPTLDSGVVLIIRPWVFKDNESEFYQNEMYRIRYKKDLSDNKHMIVAISNYYTGADHPTKYSEKYGLGWFNLGKGRLTDDGTNLSFAAIAKLNQSINAASMLPCDSGTSSGVSYYTLAFVAKKVSPYNSTAKFGWVNDANWALPPATPNCFYMCNSPTNQPYDDPYNLNYGYFNASVSGGFVSDGHNSDDDGAYPTIMQVEGVTFDNADDELEITKSILTNIRPIEFYDDTTPPK